MIDLPEVLAAAVRSEGEKAYPHECCGFLLGRLDSGGTRVVTELRPVLNGREQEEQYHRFFIGPDDFMRAERAARAQKLDVIGIYHSHPDHPARPSDFDREQALPFYSYVIVAIEAGRAGELTSWELSADRSEFWQEK